MKLRVFLALPFIAGVGVAALPARAQACPVIEGGSPIVARETPARRLHFLRHRLRRSASRARVWTWTWRSLYAVGMGQLVLLPAMHTDEDRIPTYIGAASSAVGELTTFILPLSVMSDVPALEARLAQPPDARSECARLADAEQVLIEAAASEAGGQRWYIHGANVAFNAGVGLVLGLGFDLWPAAALNGIGGAAIGELQILTQPTDAVDVLEHYRAGRLGPARTAMTWTITPMVRPSFVGVGLAGAM